MSVKQKAWEALRRVYDTGKKVITAPDRAIDKVTDKLIDMRVKQIQKRVAPKKRAPEPLEFPDSAMRRNYRVMNVGRRIIK